MCTKRFRKGKVKLIKLKNVSLHIRHKFHLWVYICSNASAYVFQCQPASAEGRHLLYSVMKDIAKNKNGFIDTHTFAEYILSHHDKDHETRNQEGLNDQAPFQKMDSNFDGFLSIQEFRKGHSGGKDADKLFQSADTDGSGSISLPEYVHGHRNHHLNKEFDRLDRNKDGLLDKSEVFKNGHRPKDISRNHPANHKGKHRPDDFHGSVWRGNPPSGETGSDLLSIDEEMEESYNHEVKMAFFDTDNDGFLGRSEHEALHDHGSHITELKIHAAYVFAMLDENRDKEITPAGNNR